MLSDAVWRTKRQFTESDNRFRLIVRQTRQAFSKIVRMCFVTTELETGYNYQLPFLNTVNETALH